MWRYIDTCINVQFVGINKSIRKQSIHIYTDNDDDNALIIIIIHCC